MANKESIFESIYHKFLTKNVRDKTKTSPNVLINPETTTISHRPDQVEDEELLIGYDPFDLWGTNVSVSNLEQDQLIKRWRNAALYPESSRCIEEITNEAINFSDDEDFMKLDLSKIEKEYEENSSQTLINEIRKSHDKAMRMFNFNENADNIFQQFIIDGTLNYEAIYPKDKEKMEKKGIIDIQLLSPIGLRKIKIKNPIVKDEQSFIEMNKEYLNAADADSIYHGIQDDPSGYDKDKEYTYYYYDKSTTENSEWNSSYNVIGSYYDNGKEKDKGKVVFDDEQIISANSGSWDPNKKMYYSYMHKPMRALNQLYLIEDAIVIYRITHAPEKKMFLIDVAGMNRKNAESYVSKIKDMYGQRKFYNTSTGSIEDRKVTVAYGEDYWFPKRADGTSSTEIKNLEGTSWNMGELTDLDYFVNKVYDAFNVPKLRRNSEATAYLGFDASANAITREELKFFKYISKIRHKFIEICYEYLRRDLIARKVIGTEDWYDIKAMIKFIFTNENEYAMIKKQQLLMTQIDLLDKIEPWHEKGYFNRKWIERNILNRTEEEIDENNKEIELETISASKKLELQDAELANGGTSEDFGGGSSTSVSSGYSGGFNALPSSAGDVGDESFPFEENAPEEATAPAEEAAPETLNQSKSEVLIDKDKMILETLAKYKDKVSEGQSITISGVKYVKTHGIFVKD